MLFVMEKPLIGCFGARLQKSALGNFDRSTFSQSIDFGQNFDQSTIQDFRISKLFLMKFAIPLLLTYKTQKHKN
jgi:hypothetical protein